MTVKEIEQWVEEFKKVNSKGTEVKENFGFWFLKGKKGEKEAGEAKEILKKENVNFNDTGKFGIEFYGKRYSIKEIKDLMLRNKIEAYVIYHKD